MPFDLEIYLLFSVTITGLAQDLLTQQSHAKKKYIFMLTNDIPIGYNDDIIY